MFWFFVIAVLVIVVALMVVESKNVSAMTPAQQKDYRLTLSHGPKNGAMKCPHCHEKGHVRTRRKVSAEGKRRVRF